MIVSIESAMADPVLAAIGEARLTALLPAAQAAVETHCARRFENTTVTEEYRGNGSRTLVLNEFPVQLVNTLKWRRGTDDWTTIVATTYRLEAAGILTLREGVFQAGLDYEVSYEYGYKTAPGDLEIAIFEMAKWISGSAPREEIASEKIGDYAVTYAATNSVPNTVSVLLRGYRKRNIGHAGGFGSEPRRA